MWKMFKSSFSTLHTHKIASVTNTHTHSNSHSHRMHIHAGLMSEIENETRHRTETKIGMRG